MDVLGLGAMSTTLMSVPMRRPLPVLVFALFGALLAACGGGGSGTKTAASNATTTPTTGGNNFAAYAQCMQAHGGQARQRPNSSSSSTSSTSAPSSTVDQATQQAAQQACASLRPAGSGGGGALGNSPQAAAYRNCLQQHGVTVPTGGQTPGATDSGGAPGGSFTSNPAFQAAQQACAALRPARSSTTSTT